MIRPASPADQAAIRTLAASYREELERAGAPYHGGGNGSWQSWFERRMNAGDVRVALSDGRPVGYAVWEVRRHPGRDGRELRITDLFVAPGDRGHRLGGGLLARALDRARGDGLARIVIDRGLDERAEALLDAFGFSPAGADGFERVLDVR